MKPLLLTLLCWMPLAAADAARDNAWRQDLDTLATQLPLRHPNLFFQTPRAVFDKAVADLRAAIPDLPDTDVMVGLARIAALPGDGHTNLWLFQTNAARAFRLLPLQFTWFADGLFCTGSSEEYGKARGARVTRIGNRSVDEAYAAVAAIISHENDVWAREMSPNYLADADVLRAVGVAPQSESVRFEFQDLAGATFTLDVQAGGPGQALAITPYPDPSSGFTPLYQQHRDRNYWFTYIESSRTLYFAYNQCAEMPGFPFAEFNDLLWATFDAKPVERVIVDLRNNTGGDSSVLLPFLQSGIARFDQFLEKGAYVIVGRRSFSSALLNAAQMHQGPVHMVGEPTGGNVNSYGEVQTLVLPNSRLNVSYSTRFVLVPEVPVGPLLPDVSVPIYSADYFARHDPFVAAALGDVAPVDTTSSGGVTVVNAGGYRAGMPVAPGSLAAALGSWGGVSGDATSLPLPTMLAGAQVLVNDLPAPLGGVRPGQINFQVPSVTPPGTATVRIVQGGSTVASGTVTIAPAAPGLFVADTVDPSRPGVLVAQGGTIQLYGTGQGSTSPRVPDGSAALAPSDFPPRVFIGAELADVQFSGLQPSFPGVWQINVKIPAGMSGQVPIFVTMSGAASNGVTARLGN